GWSLTLVRVAAEALGAAHPRGVVHRDLKPSNLFLRGGQVDDVVVLDFGIAHRSTLSQRMTGTGVLIGARDYMAPEQAGASHDICPATDVFALGCVLYECLSGEPPFGAPHLAAILGQILFAAPAPPRAPARALPPPLAALLDRMLAKDPRERPADAAALLSELSAL